MLLVLDLVAVTVVVVSAFNALEEIVCCSIFEWKIPFRLLKRR